MTKSLRKVYVDCPTCTVMVTIYVSPEEAEEPEKIPKEKCYCSSCDPSPEAVAWRAQYPTEPGWWAGHTHIEILDDGLTRIEGKISWIQVLEVSDSGHLRFQIGLVP